VRYLGERAMTVTGPATKTRYGFGPDRQVGYVWIEDLPKLVPERQMLGAPLFELVAE